jgi:YD repeat-containing protein
LSRRRGICLYIHKDALKTNWLITSISRKPLFIDKGRNSYEYDNLDRQVKVYQPDGIISETVYDSQGRVQKSIIRSGNEVRTTEYKYVMYGNITETIQPDGTTIKASYNVKGQKISETNQLGQTRYFEYDDNGQLVKVILPDGATYKYAYDSQGNQTSIIDPLNRETKFTYDDNGNQLTRTLPDGSTEYFEYDYKGRLIKQISFEGVITTYNYDEFERVESKTFFANGISETWVYTYDSLGRVSEINQNGRIVKTTYDYDENGIRISVLHEVDSDGDGIFDTAKLTEYLNDPLNITGYSQVLKQGVSKNYYIGVVFWIFIFCYNKFVFTIICVLCW